MMQTKLGLADFTYMLTKFHYNEVDDAGLIAKAAEMGLSCVQVDLALKMVPAAAAQWRCQLRAQAEAAGIELIGSTFAPATVEDFKIALQAGLELGATRVRYACGSMFVWQTPIAVDRLIEVLREVAEFAEANDITLAIENHQDYTSSELTRIMTQVNSDRIGVWLDTGNSIAMLEDPLYTAEMLAPFIKGMHLKQYVVFGAVGGFDLVGIALAEGVIDNAAVLDIVRQAAPVEMLAVLIENPLERCYIPVLNPAYLAKFPDAPLASLAPVVRLIERSREIRPQGIVLPQESGQPESQIVSMEDAHNRQAVEFARQSLGV